MIEEEEVNIKAAWVKHEKKVHTPAPFYSNASNTMECTLKKKKDRTDLLQSNKKIEHKNVVLSHTWLYWE